MIWFRLLTIASLSALLFAPMNGAAQSTPVPKKKSDEIESYEEKLTEATAKKKVLEQKVNTISDTLSNTKQKLIDIAEEIQNTENKLKDYEERIVKLELKKSVLEDNLKTDRTSIARLVLALERIRRTPPEAMLANPDTPYKTAQSALLMGNILPSIDRHSEKLRKNLETLNSVKEELLSDKDSLIKTAENLNNRHIELSGLIEKRQNLLSETSKDIEAREVEIQKISLQAKNLEELVNKIKKDEEKQHQQELANTQKTGIIKKPALSIPQSGDARLPISGVIRTGYKEHDVLGAKSKGLTIEGRSGGIVIAPMNGVIQFTGAFKRYGNIVIIEHDGGYHSLVAGLDSISAVVGDIVKSGEPIGILPNSSLIPRPTLYYELRKSGKPINPSLKFPDLG
ncbi:MAG: peptidoglycan DD-metalloendopeptidase family protein [Alphaproteobacteria bacterium]|nr:peptidoglycan DD-metalloendopeptidase family protein [Alphaproteobacteria bacterium]